MAAHLSMTSTVDEELQVDAEPIGALALSAVAVCVCVSFVASIPNVNWLLVRARIWFLDNW